MTETISVPRDLLLELRDSANDCYNNEVRRYKDDRRRIIYKALVDKADELLAAPKAEQPPVQEPARNPDVLALNAAREIMALVYGPTPLGGSPQLLAQIQCVVSEAIVYAAPQPVSDEVPCSTHPDAPHGFNRNGSHSLDRYVCDCEGWVPLPAPPEVKP